jgi:hypothetical protein
MGTNGTNKFTDYPGTSRGSAKATKGGGGSASGSPSDVPLCERQLAGVALEEVGRCDYFTTHGSLPTVGTPVAVRTTLVSRRVAVETTAGEVVGFLPTEFNYLLRCMTEGFSYAGKVTSVVSKPVPVVRVDLEGRK